MAELESAADLKRQWACGLVGLWLVVGQSWPLRRAGSMGGSSWLGVGPEN